MQLSGMRISYCIFRRRNVLVESQEIDGATGLTHSTQLHCRRFAQEASTLCFIDTIILQKRFSNK
jgi:hypothetical protein